METIREGSKGPDVVKWQTFLGISADGDFGPGTKSATIVWQTNNGLTGDGVVGPATWSKAGFESDAVPHTSPVIPYPPTVPPRVGSVGDAVELPWVNFKLTPDQAANALSNAYARVTGKRPNANVLALMIAQTGFETGQWSLPNYNYGGIKFASSKDSYFQFLDCGEIINGVQIHHTAADRSPMCEFAAHLTAVDGAEHYVRTLQGRPNWWNGLHTGTVDGYIKGLTIQPYAYFTAVPAAYLAGVQKLYAQFASVAKRYAAGTIVGFVVFAFGLSAYALWRRSRRSA